MDTPVRFSAARFAEYKPYLETVLGNLPAETIFRPSGLSAASLVQRLREARAAKRKYGYPLKHEGAFSKHQRDLVFIEEGDTVVAGLRDQLKDSHAPAGVTLAEPNPNQLRVVCCNLSTLSHLAALLSARAFSPHPSFILAGHIDPATIAELEKHYDVAIVQNNNETIMT